MSYHTTEDREIETAMEPSEEIAERLTTRSYECAIEEYQHVCPDLFRQWNANTDAETYGDRLAGLLKKADERMRLGDPRPELLSPDDFELLEGALLLPYDLRYNEYSLANDRGNSDEDGYDWIEHWESSEETYIRDAVCDALYDYCIDAAAVAKMIGALREQRLFMRIIRTLESDCAGSRTGGELGGLTAPRSKLVCSWLFEAHESLWAQVVIEGKLVDWHVHENLWKKRADAIIDEATRKTTAENAVLSSEKTTPASLPETSVPAVPAENPSSSGPTPLNS